MGVDSTTLEADAAMKSIVRKDTGEDWKQYLTRLMKEEGLIEEDDDPPSDEELRKFDKSRKDKKVSNDEWISPTDPDSRITKMKDGTTHLAYKAEHVVDLETEVILAAEIYHADYHDTQTWKTACIRRRSIWRRPAASSEIEEAVADKGYHSQRHAQRTCASTRPYRTYIPEPELKHDRVWTDKPPEQKAAVLCQSAADARRARTRNCNGCEAS